MSTETKGVNKGRLMNQKQIQEEWGIPTRDVLRAVQTGKFPSPVRVFGKVRWFNRAEVARYLRKRQDDSAD